MRWGQSLQIIVTASDRSKWSRIHCILYWECLKFKVIHLAGLKAIQAVCVELQRNGGEVYVHSRIFVMSGETAMQDIYIGAIVRATRWEIVSIAWLWKILFRST